MKRQNEQSVGEVLKQLIKQYRLEDKLTEINIKERWKDIVGITIDKHTLDVYLVKQVLYVKLDSPALKNELSYSKSKIIKILNKRFDKEIVTELIFI